MSLALKRGAPGHVLAHTSPQTSPSTTIGTPMSDSLPSWRSNATLIGSASGSSTAVK